MESRSRLIILWLLTVIGMILHFNYHVGDFMYGIEQPAVNNGSTEPVGRILIRNVFYHLPVIWIVILLYAQKRWLMQCFFILSIGYCIAHLAHLAGQIKDPGRTVSQLSLLLVVAVVSAVLVKEHYNAIPKKS